MCVGMAEYAMFKRRKADAKRRSGNAQHHSGKSILDRSCLLNVSIRAKLG